MFKKYSLDMLTEVSVSVISQNVITIEGVDMLVGGPHRKAFVNSVQGRIEVEQELPIPQSSAIFAVWGEHPSSIYETE